MIPVYQTTFGVPTGNCFAACLASLLETTLHELREFSQFYSDYCQRYENEEIHRKPDEVTEWWLKLIDVLRPFNRQPAFLNDPWMAPAGFAIAAGTGPRGHPHAVIVLNGELVHDPFPAGGGLTEIDSYVVLLSCSPRKAIRLPDERPFRESASVGLSGSSADAAAPCTRLSSSAIAAAAAEADG